MEKEPETFFSTITNGEISNLTTMNLEAYDNKNADIKEEVREDQFLGCDAEGFDAKQKVNLDSEDIKMKLEPNISEELDIKEELLSDNSDSDTQAEQQGTSSTNQNSKETIDWPEQDLTTLINRIEQAVPDKDNMAYCTRVEKLNWDAVAFDKHSAADCKKTWLLIQKRVRRFRLLTEVLQDAKEWVVKPWTDYYRRKQTKNCPDMPRRPLSVYMLFYLKMKDEILARTPDPDMTEVTKEISQIYKNLTPKEREKYVSMARSEKKIYEQKLEEFYRMHPEIPRQLEKPVNMKDKKPSTPFCLYYKEQLKNSSNLDNNVFKEECKKQWKILPDKEKIVWINLAVDNEAKYQDELKDYMTLNPDFTPATLKPILTKEEKLLKERLSGKPVKPPTSAYSLFTAMMLQSDEIKKIPPKERMKAVADEWKNSSDEEKKPFQKRVHELMKQYKKDLAVYLKSLNANKQQKQSPPAPKRKSKEPENPESVPEKKKKPNNEGENPESVPEKKKKPNNEGENPESVPDKKKKPNNKETDLEKMFKAEPPQPPMSGFYLFSNTYKGPSLAKTAWKNLLKQEKEEFEIKVKAMKQKYIKEYEKFLKSLSKQELLAFSQMKHQKNSMDGPNIKEEVEASSNSSNSESENE